MELSFIDDKNTLLFLNLMLLFVNINYYLYFVFFNSFQVINLTK
jgi:hypothetical protein